ncbi:hypothetical protein [Acinetobacter venetianus]|uniref:hypothetical protein n=1 Tax=Acinetobacter venetianus TaxID=52133 RepID=UPI003A8DEB05
MASETPKTQSEQRQRTQAHSWPFFGKQKVTGTLTVSSKKPRKQKRGLQRREFMTRPSPEKL